MHLRGCCDHAIQLTDILDGCRESCALLEAHHSLLAQRTNEVMRIAVVLPAFFARRGWLGRRRR